LAWFTVAETPSTLFSFRSMRVAQEARELMVRLLEDLVSERK
jgi:hypothetical protein